MDERLTLFLTELRQQCQELNCFEFEFYWEMWGVLWTPWFLEVNNTSLSFTTNAISDEDLDCLIQNGAIELIKVYSQDEMSDEFDRKRYRVNCLAK